MNQNELHPDHQKPFELVHYSFPKISQFKDVIRTVCTHHDYQGKDALGVPIYAKEPLTPYPIIIFKGFVKLHGTNAGIVLAKDKRGNIVNGGKPYMQSRSNVLSLIQDNAGFWMAMQQKDLTFLFENAVFNEYVAVFGEWCCGNIQKSVALAEIPTKKFIIFALCIDGVWIETDLQDNEQDIWNINQFESYEVVVDFGDPQRVSTKLDEITLAVEEYCPVGKYFGVGVEDEKQCCVGEGVVWSAFMQNGEVHRFKVKGVKHAAGGSKPKTLTPISEEVLNSVSEFVDKVATLARVEQAVDITQKANGGLMLQKAHTNQIINWVLGDIQTEEEHLIIENNINWKVAGGKCSQRVREIFFGYLESGEFKVPIRLAAPENKSIPAKDNSSEE